jgi:hypothetical protein
MKHRFFSPALLELANAVEFYKTDSKEVAAGFLKELKKALLRVDASPETLGRISPNRRRCLLQRFPYGIIYSMKGGEVVIVSAMPLHRDPESWKENLQTHRHSSAQLAVCTWLRMCHSRSTADRKSTRLNSSH